MRSTHRRRWSKPSRFVRANLVLTLATVLLLTACQIPDEGASETSAPTDPGIADFKNCTANLSSTLTEEQRGRVDVAVKSITRLIGGHGSVEIVNTVTSETSDPVNLAIIERCFALAQTFPNTPPETKGVYVRAARRMANFPENKASMTLRPSDGELPAAVDVWGSHWPPGARLRITTSDGNATEIDADGGGGFHAAAIDLGEQARLDGSNYATVFVQTVDAATTVFDLGTYTITQDPTGTTSETTTEQTTEETTDETTGTEETTTIAEPTG